MEDGTGTGDAHLDAGIAAVQRKIVHCDMDAFFASCEQRDFPELRGRPVAVGGSAERGVVAAASYEARRFGVRSAMSSVMARKLCPELVFVKTRFEVYREVSMHIRSIFAEHTPIIEPLSLDEAYLDVTTNLQGIETATEVARRIRASIREETQLTASAGVSYCKFLAKIASDHRKPDGLFVITPRMGPEFVKTLPIGRFHGIGPATEAKMKEMGIRHGADLRAVPLETLRQRFGKSGDYFHAISRGIDDRPVRPDRVRKSAGAENTFDRDLRTLPELSEALAPIVDKAWRHCAKTDARPRTVTLKVKYADFQQITRSRSVRPNVANPEEVLRVAGELLEALFPLPMDVRLLGVSLSNFEGEADEGSDPGDTRQMSFGF
jgi:DNA polymerase-4